MVNVVVDTDAVVDVDTLVDLPDGSGLDGVVDEVADLADFDFGLDPGLDAFFQVAGRAALSMNSLAQMFFTWLATRLPRIIWRSPVDTT